MADWILTVEREIEAPPEAIFDVLVHPARHHLIDGSGMLRGSPDGEDERLALGSKFGMRMHLFVNYGTVNRVVELEEGRRIAWQTGPEGTMGRLVAGRVWRYALEPTERGTRVSESWDITGDHQRMLLKLGGIYWNKTRRDMERTLERLDRLVTAKA